MATTSLNGGSIFTALIPLYVTAPVAGSFRIVSRNVDDVFRVSVNGGPWANNSGSSLSFSAGETKRIALWYQNAAWSGSYLNLQFEGVVSGGAGSLWIYGAQDTSSFISIKCLPSSELLALAGRLPNDLPSAPNSTTIAGFSGLIYYTRQDNAQGTAGTPPNLNPVSVSLNSVLPAEPSGYFTSTAINFWSDLRPFSRPSGTVEWPAITKVGMISQTIAITPVTQKAPNAAPFTVTATASSGLPVTLSVQSGSDVATISGNTITLTGQTGTVVIAANQSGDADNHPAPEVTTSFVVAKLSQSIIVNQQSQYLNRAYTLDSVPTTSFWTGQITSVVEAKRFDDTINTVSSTVGLSGGSDWSINVQVGGGTPFKVGYDDSGSLPLGNSFPVGSSFFLCYDGANKLRAIYNADSWKTPIGAPFNLVQSEIESVIFAVANKAVNAAPFTLRIPPATSGLPVTLSVQSGPATISGNTITLTGETGIVVLATNQAGDAAYNPAPEVTANFTVAKLPQTITLASISSKAPNAAPFEATATASSGLPVTLSVQSGPATISGNTITLTGQTGTVVIAANQPGDANYAAATQVTRSFTVSKLSQSISLTAISSKTPGSAPFAVTATASSGLPVDLSVKTGSAIATISGNTITLTGQTGTVVIAANQTGDANYTAAAEVTTSFTVAKLSQSITLGSISSKAPWAAPFSVTATSSSGLPVVLSVKSGDAVATISGNTITLTGQTGTVTIAANQSGGINHDAAPEVTRSFSVELPVVATVRLRKNQFSITDPYNDVTLAGGNYRYARWKKEGTIPAGLNWEGNNEGLRFWGTPAVAGTFTATFEGPYLPNFLSSATVGSSGGGNTICGINGTKNGGILVTAFSIRFVVTEVIVQNPVIDGIQFFGPRTYGEALSGVLQGKLARRSEWGSDKRCIGSRPFTENISDSSSARNLTTVATDNFLIWNYTAPASRTAQDGSSVYVLRNDQLDEDDITGADWVISDSSGMTFPGESTLDTLNARRQIVLPETPTDYATFNGDPFDGEKWRTIMDAEIPLSANSRSFGDFFLHEDFKGMIKINFWTSIDGRISPYPWASFGLKMFFGIMEGGIAQYRNPDPGITLSYDVASTSAGVFNSSLVTEGKRGVFNLTCAALPPNSSAKAHLKIIALK